MRFFAALIAPLALALSGCATTSTTADAAPMQSGAVSSADPRATAAGGAILAQGGSATDAAIAVMLALTVVEPQSSGIGGGGFMVRSDAKGLALTTYDGRETAPAAATPTRFLDASGKVLGRDTRVFSGLSVGVPGNLALAAKAHAAHGKLAWAKLAVSEYRLANGTWPANRKDARIDARGPSDAALGPQGQVYELDFDRGRIRARGAWEQAVCARLRRSLVKITRELPAGRFDEAAWREFLRGCAEA